MIDKPIVYRPRSLAVGWMVMLAFAAAPVILFFATGSWLLAIVVALVLTPFGLVIFLSAAGSSMTLTDDGVHLRTEDENVKLAWADIDRFDCVDAVVIHTHGGGVHRVPWMTTAPAQRFLGTLGYGDYMAQELNSILVDQTGGTPVDGEIERVRPKITAENPVARAKMAEYASGGFAAAALGIAIHSRVWWLLLLSGAATLVLWLRWRRRLRSTDRVL